ncbi:unnamed protein product [Prorocentrum cordatum]|uniref:Uncharacterized protein n=1 Tax=Prorocentrum cordatum TaxID=2364126 RepID=A0ABN9VB29_9DINO|nr:unnamed protein product [Polarella glacialis]
MSGDEAKHLAEQRTQSTLPPELQCKSLSECTPPGTVLQSPGACSPPRAAPPRAACALEPPLEAAAGLLREVDQVPAAFSEGPLLALPPILRTTELSRLRELKNDTTSVLARLGSAAEGVAAGALPMLRAALASSRTKRTAMANAIGLAQSLAAGPHDEVEEVLDSHVLLIDRVHYVHRCLCVTLEGQGTQGGAGADADALGRQAGEALGTALVHLDEEFSGRLRMLRRTRCLLARVAASAQDLRGGLLSGPKSLDQQLGFEPFVAALEQFCQLCCPKGSGAAPGRPQVPDSQAADAGSCTSAMASSSARNAPRSWLLTGA